MNAKRLLLVFLALCTGSASADYFDGNALKKLIDSSNPTDTAMFRGYIAGLQDANNGTTFCVDPNVRLSQSAAIVQKYFAENPQLWHLAAHELVVSALTKSFPCRK